MLREPALAGSGPTGSASPAPALAASGRYFWGGHGVFPPRMRRARHGVLDEGLPFDASD